MVNPPPTGLQPLTSSKDMAASGRPGQRVGNLPTPLARPAPASKPQRHGPTPPTGAPPFQVGLDKALALDLGPQNPLPQQLLGPNK
jgi:hypothetical protein